MPPPVPRSIKPLIVGMDIATQCGVAYGRADGRPTAMTWNLKKGGDTRPAKLGYLGDMCFDLFAKLQPDMLFYEQGMSARVACEIGCSEDTFALLRGAIGVVEATAAKSRVPIIRAVGVQEARRHLLGRGKIPKGDGKQLVADRCRALGWVAANLDESDALAIWSLGCGQANPLNAHMTTPLFSGAPA